MVQGFVEVCWRDARYGFGRVDVDLAQNFAGVVCQYGCEAGYGVGGVDVGMVESAFGFGGEGRGKVGDDVIGAGSEVEGSLGFIG